MEVTAPSSKNIIIIIGFFSLGLSGFIFVSANAESDFLYAISLRNHQVISYDALSGDFLKNIDIPVELIDNPPSLVADSEGRVYVSSRENDRILRFNGITGEFIDVFIDSGSGGLDSPFGLAFGPDGNLFVVSEFNSKVLHFDGVTGEFIDVFVDSSIDTPLGIIFDVNGDMYITNWYEDSITKFNGIQLFYVK